MALIPPIARRAAALLDAAVRHLSVPGPATFGFEVRLLLARLLRWTDRRTDERIDVSRAGRALLAAEPGAIATLARRLPHGTVLVSGTNGKTTTTNLLATLVGSAGLRPIVNRIGANMAGGIAAELLGAARIGGRIDGDLGVFEADELWLGRVLAQISPRALILTNLFRDQLDRMGEVDHVADEWERVVTDLGPGTVLVLGADDPRLARLGDGRSRVLRFGMASSSTEVPASADLPDCRRCGEPLAIGPTHIGHLGEWRCEACGDARRPPDVAAEGVEALGLDGSRFELIDRVDGEETRQPIELALPGRFNVANALAAVAGLRALDLPVRSVAPALRSARPAFGRAERVDLHGRATVLVLVKNPVGLDEALALLADRPALDVAFLLNDRDIDGRDVSWIWDADLESLAPNIRTATCGGARAADAALRLDCSGVDAHAIELVGDIDRALERATARANGELIVLANYTAMLDARELIAERGFAARYWW